ncbi:lysylphosphatidylglycerol synthase transmembrane domain-containing protein [Chondromyces apiculatus]|uniref:lysylphosphatidylglycerol synthase transmembrane domain-containing protein n=1 Tax=Chondromyces apiculatus TaxID=51 RepID=UPI0012DE0C97|nr:lysylphosphatidylglycerol synthase transmembrane domain-containing protein [Chondromyces apiculatus]
MSKLGRRLVVVMLLGIAVYGVIILSRGLTQISVSLQTYAWWTFAAACGLAFTNYLLRFLKWEYYLAHLDVRGIPKGESLLTFLSGFVLTVTPGKVGEVFKSVILQQTRGIPIARTAPIVVAERVTDLIGVIVIITVGSISFPGGALWATLGAIVVGVLLMVVASTKVSDGLLRALTLLPGPLGRLAARIGPKIAVALHGLRGLTAPSKLIWPTILSIGAWGLEGLGLWVILGGFSVRPPLSLTAFFYATATLAGALVPLPGGLGVTDKLLEEQMAHLGGVPSATATAAMLLIRFATLWFAVAVGFVALGALRLRYPQMNADAAPPNDGGAKP